MDNYLLDTDVCIELFRGNERVISHIESVGRKRCFVSEITIAELFYGAAKSGRSEHFSDVSKILQLFELVPLFPSLRLFGENKNLLQRQGTPIDDFDLLIGSCAIHNNMVMVTSNSRHFSHLPNIHIEDWAEKTTKKHK